MQKLQIDNENTDQKMKLDHHAAMQKLELESERLDIEREKIAASMNETAAKIRSDEAKAAADLDAKAQTELMRTRENATSKEIDMMERARDRERFEHST